MQDRNKAQARPETAQVSPSQPEPVDLLVSGPPERRREWRDAVGRHARHLDEQGDTCRYECLPVDLDLCVRMAIACDVTVQRMTTPEPVYGPLALRLPDGAVVVTKHGFERYDLLNLGSHRMMWGLTDDDRTVGPVYASPPAQAEGGHRPGPGNGRVQPQDTPGERVQG